MTMNEEKTFKPYKLLPWLSQDDEFNDKVEFVEIEIDVEKDKDNKIKNIYYIGRDILKNDK